MRKRVKHCFVLRVQVWRGMDGPLQAKMECVNLIEFANDGIMSARFHEA
jgi:hypothetical protein